MPYFARRAPLDIDAVGGRLARPCATAPNCWRRPASRSSSAAGWSAEAGVYLTPHHRSQGELRPDLPHHRRRPPSYARRQWQLRPTLRRNYPSRIANRFGAPPDEEVTVTGCLCTPLDLLADEVDAPARRTRRPRRHLLRRCLRPDRQPAGVLGHPPASEMLVYVSRTDPDLGNAHAQSLSACAGPFKDRSPRRSRGHRAGR